MLGWRMNRGYNGGLIFTWEQFQKEADCGANLSLLFLLFFRFVSFTEGELYIFYFVC